MRSGSRREDPRFAFSVASFCLVSRFTRNLPCVAGPSSVPPRSYRQFQDFDPSLTLLSGLVAYLLRPTEMFARSYSQFIAERAGSSELLKELGGVRSRPIEVLYPEQWNETDFRPIAEEFVALFRKRGWMHEHH